MSDSSYNLDHLEELEAESIYVLREVAAQFDRPAILFSGGKDSIVVTHLAAKAFAPGRIPMPLSGPAPAMQANEGCSIPLQRHQRLSRPCTL